MKKILYSFIVVAGLFAATSCEDMLMTGNDSMVTDPELDAKTDSVFYALGIAQAMQQFQQLLSQYPTHDKAAGGMLKLGLSLAASGRPDQAEQTLRQVIERYPGSDAAAVANERLRSLMLARQSL